MRLIVFFDLPMVTKTENHAYVQFRRFLLNDGYDMIQRSVYARLLNGNDDHDKPLKRLVDSLPPVGSIRCMTVTEKQFAGIRLLVRTPLFRKRGSGEPDIAVLIPEFHQKEFPPSYAGREFGFRQIVAFRGERGSYNLWQCRYRGVCSI